jgi:hypothetical protein
VGDKREAEAQAEILDGRSVPILAAKQRGRTPCPVVLCALCGKDSCEQRLTSEKGKDIASPVSTGKRGSELSYAAISGFGAAAAQPAGFSAWLIR